MDELTAIVRERDQKAAQTACCQVLLNDIEVMADIGAFTAECGVPQPLKIHVALSVITPLNDELSEAFDYSNIRAYALELAGQRFNLIETFARRLAEMCLASRLVMQADVRIDKPLAVPGCLAGARIRLSKH